MPAQRHPDSGSGRQVPVEHRRLPAAPLLAAIHQLADRRHVPVEQLLGEGGAWALRTVRDARAAGELTVQAGERLCDQVLGWHPRMVWGDLYDRTIADTPHTAAAPPGTLTGWRQGCRCLDCREANRTAISTRRTRGHARPGGERPA